MSSAGVREGWLFVRRAGRHALWLAGRDERSGRGGFSIKARDKRRRKKRASWAIEGLRD